jgi:hypothetical protein
MKPTFQPVAVIKSRLRAQTQAGGWVRSAGPYLVALPRRHCCRPGPGPAPASGDAEGWERGARSDSGWVCLRELGNGNGNGNGNGKAVGGRQEGVTRIIGCGPGLDERGAQVGSYGADPDQMRPNVSRPQSRGRVGAWRGVAGRAGVRMKRRAAGLRSRPRRPRIGTRPAPRTATGCRSGAGIHGSTPVRPILVGCAALAAAALFGGGSGASFVPESQTDAEAAGSALASVAASSSRQSARASAAGAAVDETPGVPASHVAGPQVSSQPFTPASAGPSGMKPSASRRPGVPASHVAGPQVPSQDLRPAVATGDGELRVNASGQLLRPVLARAPAPTQQFPAVAQRMRTPHEFFFTRGIYSSGGFGRGNRWSTDYPKADQQFIDVFTRLIDIDAYRRENPVRLDDPQLWRFPFLYILEVGGMYMSDAEVEGLRNYLDRGGFLVVDDFWGTLQWQNFEQQIRRVFPDRPIVELPMSHSIFDLVYKMDRILTVPAIGNLIQRYEQDGVTPYVFGIFDDKDRLMVLINWNTDLGDAWEWAEQPEYPVDISTYAFKMGINFIAYSMAF